jgi:hypothetical protein
MVTSHSAHHTIIFSHSLSIFERKCEEEIL